MWSAERQKGRGMKTFLFVSLIAAQLIVLPSLMGVEPQLGWPVTVSIGVKSPTVADLDGDGIPEILVSSFTGTYVYSSNGTLLPGWPFAPFSGTSAHPLVGDIDGDDELDIIVKPQNGNGTAFALTREGKLKPGWPIEVPTLIHLLPR